MLNIFLFLFLALLFLAFFVLFIPIVRDKKKPFLRRIKISQTRANLQNIQEVFQEKDSGKITSQEAAQMIDEYVDKSNLQSAKKNNRVKEASKRKNQGQ